MSKMTKNEAELWDSVVRQLISSGQTAYAAADQADDVIYRRRFRQRHGGESVELSGYEVGSSGPNR